MQYLKNSIYYAILAGGNGERLWPLSRRSKPKQLLPFIHDKSLLEQTVERARLLTDKDHVVIVSTVEYEDQISQLIGDQVGFVLSEPCARNTAPAIILLALLLHQEDPDSILVTLPADHYIQTQQTFAEFVHHALDYAAYHNEIILLGVKPTYPETNYGYIEYAHPDDAISYPARVVRFHEKPTLLQAQYYTTRSSFLWHSGIVCAKTSVILEEAACHAPTVYQAVLAYHQGVAAYDSIPASAFDTAVLERSKKLAVLPMDVIWCDVGNLATYLSMQHLHHQLEGQVIAIDAHHNLVDVKDKLVALIGVDDICVVQTDDVLLIVRRSDTEKIKQVLDVLRTGSGQTYL